MAKVQAAEWEEGLEPVDAELLAIPASIAWTKVATFVAMAFTAACALALALTVRADVAYFFSSSRPVDAGNVLSASAGELPLGQYITLRGEPMASNAVTYERAMFGGRYVAFALAGQRDVWVQVPVGDDASVAMRRGEFRGRLVPAGELGLRFDAVREYLAGTMGQPVSPSTLVLLADEPPRAALSALALVVFALLVVVIDALLLLRWFRPLPVR